MQALLITLYVLTALLLIGVVLLQQPKNSAGLFSGAGQSLLGTGGKTFITKFTTILAAVFMLLCLVLAALPQGRGPKSDVADLLQKQQEASDQTAAQNAAAAVSAPAPPSDGLPPAKGGAPDAKAPAPPKGSAPAPKKPTSK